MIKKTKQPKPFSTRSLTRGACLENNNNNPKTKLAARATLVVHPHDWFSLGARLSQRVAMDDLASYFVEERSKVR